MAALVQTKTDKTLQYWLSRSYISENTRKRIQEAAIILVPEEGFRGHEGPTFPVRSGDFFNYLQKNVDAAFPVEIAIEDEYYKELSLHSDLTDLGSILVSMFVLPLVVNIVSDYINRRIENRSKTAKERTIVKLNVTAFRQTPIESHAIRFEYEGSAADFQTIMGRAVSDASRSNESASKPDNDQPNLQLPDAKP